MPSSASCREPNSTVCGAPSNPINSAGALTASDAEYARAAIYLESLESPHSELIIVVRPSFRAASVIIPEDTLFATRYRCILSSRRWKESSCFDVCPNNQKLRPEIPATIAPPIVLSVEGTSRLKKIERHTADKKSIVATVAAITAAQ
jgi:hypothetical protein